MGLMDRVRAQATQIAQQAQEAAQEGRARFDQAQAGRRGDMLLRQLGALVFAERTGRGTADSQGRIDQLISDLSAVESQNGLNLADPSQPGFGQSVFGQSAPGQSAPGQSEPGQTAPGQSAPGQPAGQPPAGQGAQEQSGSDQSAFGQQSPDQQPPGQQSRFPANPQGPQTPAGGHGATSVDTTTSFFSAPDDDVPGGPPQS